MILTTTFNQMMFLFSLITIGYILVKLKLMPENSEMILSKLENYVFLPALVLGNFMSNFTVQRLWDSRTLVFYSILIELVVIAISIVVVRLCSKDKYIQNIYLYGLSFSNFGFMGNAVVSALFPEIFSEYIIFTIVLWIAIYVWGVPVLLMGDNEQKQSIGKNLKKIINPMFIGMIVGMLIGILGIKTPTVLNTLVKSLGDCMSPVAMLLTGMTVGRYKLKDILPFKSIYVITVIRLIVYPLIFIGISKFLPKGMEVVTLCALCSLAMPLGLNTIVIPSAYGKDTRVSSGMAIVSHLASCVTIPIMFSLLLK